MPEAYNVHNIIISGGNTLVRAVGDKTTDVPGLAAVKQGTL